MDYCTVKGFLVVLLIQRCTSEGLSTPIQTSTVVRHQDGQTLPKEPELPTAEVVPIVSPPSLKEVQQAVQEASEQVEGRGAEEVLKELLERVVEAALGQVEGGSEAKADVVRGAVEEEVLGAETRETEADTEAEVLKVAKDENMGFKEGDTSVEEKQEVADAFEVVAEEGKGVVEGEAGAETEVRGAEGVEIIDESLGSRFSQDVVEGAGAALEETVGDLAEEETGERSDEEQETSEEEEEERASEAEETPSVVEVAETIEETEPILGVADVEQIGQALGKDEAPGEESQVDETEGEAIAPPSDNYKIETTQTAIGEAVEEEEELNTVNDSEGREAQDEQIHLGKGGTAEDVEAEATGEEGDSLIGEESVAVADEGGDQKAGEEEQIASETSRGGEKEGQEVPVISGPEPEDGAGTSTEQRPEVQTPTPNPALGGGEGAGGNSFSHGNEIITPTDNLMPHDPAVARPTLDNFPLAETAQAERAEPGEAKELVEDTAGATDHTPISLNIMTTDKRETKELGLEAWKIGAIFAAVFLILEAVVIVVYVLKCRNKTSAPALQRACEEGCVEPEAATGSDCCDDTLPVGNGDTQQIAALDPSDVASSLATKKEQRQDENAIAMSDLLPSSTEESANTGPGLDSSQDLRTSIL